VTSTPPEAVEQSVRIAASPETVWRFWTDPERMREWWGAAELDPRPGGTYVVRMGDGGPVMRGWYVELVPHERLVFTFGWETPDTDTAVPSAVPPAVPPGSTTVEVTLVDDGGHTVVTVRHTGLPPAEAERHRAGWGRFLPLLARAADEPAAEWPGADNPEVARIWALRTAAELRATWDALEQRWAAAVTRARHLPEPARHERVDGEWSFTETVRHLTFAIDAWVRHAALGEVAPFHAAGRPHSSYPLEHVRALGIDADARPSFDAAVECWQGRMATVRHLVDSLTDADLGRPWVRPPGPGYPEGPMTVGECLQVVMEEAVEHHRYATRDLSVLEARG
jgi:uncharacterized protein YndB with AHSA1/START domain